MSESLCFGRIEVRPRQRQLLIDGVPAALGARAFDLLLGLIERRDRVISKSELLDLVWPGLVVEENNLQVQVSTLRKLLGPRAIATVPGRGYRFTGAVDDNGDGSADTAAPAASSTAVPAQTAATARTNLPAERAPLYGREADLQALASLLQSRRLVTVVGAGGIGKSRLAQASAQALVRQWADGAWMVELAGLSDPALLPSAVAHALEIKLVGGEAAVAELVLGLETRKALLVLDNCEHLLDAVVALVQAVLRGSPGVTMLLTSQEPLRLPEEQQLRIAPLAVPASPQDGSARTFGALALFEARVQAVDPRFVLSDDNLPLAIDICRRLDGLPLAIELAAARVATLGLRTVRDKLDARLRLLTGGSRATLRRHQTLRAALEWSCSLLNDGERIVFRRLGVFAGGFTAELAQAVCADGRFDEWSVLELMSALVDKSLVVADAGEPPRYRLLESARAFALEQLAAAEETLAVLKLHTTVMERFLRRVDDDNLDGKLRTDQYAELVVPEVDNLRAAYAWATAEGGDPHLAISLAGHAGSLIDYAPDCADWLLPLRGQVEGDGLDPSTAARYWRALAASNMVGHVSLSDRVDAAARAAELYRALGQLRRLVSSLLQLSLHRSAQGLEDAAKSALDEARVLVRPDWPAEFRIRLLRRDGHVARTAGRMDEALALHREAVRVSASTGDWRLEVIARSNLLDLLWQTGPAEEAVREARALAGELRLRPAADADMDNSLANVIGVLSELGLIEEASQVAREALPIMRRTRNLFAEQWIHLFWRRGQVETASLLLSAFDARSERGGEASQPNEERLVETVRAALGAPAATAAGAAIGDAELWARIDRALAVPAPCGIESKARG